MVQTALGRSLKRILSESIWPSPECGPAQGKPKPRGVIGGACLYTRLWGRRGAACCSAPLRQIFSTLLTKPSNSIVIEPSIDPGVIKEPWHEPTHRCQGSLGCDQPAAPAPQSWPATGAGGPPSAGSRFPCCRDLNFIGTTIALT
jgi:hypothetical protein